MMKGWRVQLVSSGKFSVKLKILSLEAEPLASKANTGQQEKQAGKHYVDSSGNAALGR